MNEELIVPCLFSGCEELRITVESDVESAEECDTRALRGECAEDTIRWVIYIQQQQWR